MKAILLFLIIIQMSYSGEILLFKQNKQNLRWAVFEDDGKSAWLYLTEPKIKKPVGSIFVYSRVDAISKEQAKKMMAKGEAPTLTKNYKNKFSIQRKVKENDIEIKWSKNAKAVTVLVKGTPYAMIVIGEKEGNSKAVSQSGFFGRVWDQKAYDKYFKE